MSSGPKTRTRVKAGAIARARKPSGKLNKEDLKNAAKGLKIGPNDSLAKRKAIEEVGRKELEENRKRKAIISRYLALQKKEKPSSREFQHRENAVAKKRRTLGFTTGKQTGVAMHHPKSKPKINKAYKGASKNLKRKK